jgi:hypothetical protein
MEEIINSYDIVAYIYFLRLRISKVKEARDFSEDSKIIRTSQCTNRTILTA